MPGNWDSTFTCRDCTTKLCTGAMLQEDRRMTMMLQISVTIAAMQYQMLKPLHIL